MLNLVEELSIAVSCLALFLIVFVVVFNLYLIRRNGFYVSANCWFCNSWTKVLYRDRNKFNCPSCLQYNGFGKDGGYNKVIKAQHSIPKNSKTVKNIESHRNGLCTYCNNNQQLKIYQLAKFTPLNEENYDAEIDHFQKQLEKAYKLCKKCEKVLKATIDKQHAWIFGNRLKILRQNGLSLLDLTKSTNGIAKGVKHSFCLKLIRYTLILFSVLVICQVLNVKVDYPTKRVQKYIPDVLASYRLIFKDFYIFVMNASRSFDDEVNSLNSYVSGNIKFQTTKLVPITAVGVLLEFIFAIWVNKSAWWKVNEMLGWILLLLTSLISFTDVYFIFVNSLQVFTVSSLLYSYMTNYSLPRNKKSISRNKFQFKKLRKAEKRYDEGSEDTCEEGSEDEREDIAQTSNLSSKSKKSAFKNFNNSHCQSYRASSPIQSYPFHTGIRNTAVLNNSFTTAKNTGATSVLNSSFQNTSNCSLNSDLHRSLDNLHLNNINFKPMPCTSPVFSVSSTKRPILSPAKLKNVTQNPWTAGGFWKNDANILSVAADYTNLSRSSSQSSGFASANEPINNHFSSLPPSRAASVSGDIERTSILSEPAYHFKPINTSTGQFQNGLSSPQQLYYKTDNNTFYPILNPNSMLHIQSNMQHPFESSFGNLSLKSFGTRVNMNSQVSFSEKPISSLFKNLNGMAGSQVFKKPQC